MLDKMKRIFGAAIIHKMHWNWSLKATGSYINLISRYSVHNTFKVGLLVQRSFHATGTVFIKTLKIKTVFLSVAPRVFKIGSQTRFSFLINCNTVLQSASQENLKTFVLKSQVFSLKSCSLTFWLDDRVISILYWGEDFSEQCRICCRNIFLAQSW